MEELALHKMPCAIQKSTTKSQPPFNFEMCFYLQWKVKQQKRCKTFTKGEGSELQSSLDCLFDSTPSLLSINLSIKIRIDTFSFVYKMIHPPRVNNLNFIISTSTLLMITKSKKSKLNQVRGVSAFATYI